MRTNPAVKKLFYHSWWLDALIILGLLTILFILIKLCHKGYKFVKKHRNKRITNNLDHANNESTRTALNRTQMAVELDTLEPPVIMGIDGGDSLYNLSSGDGPLTATDIDATSANESDGASLKNAMTLATVQHMVHELHKSQEMKDLIQQTIQHTIQNSMQALSPALTSAVALNPVSGLSPETLNIDDFAYAQYSDDHDIIDHHSNNNSQTLGVPPILNNGNNNNSVLIHEDDLRQQSVDFDDNHDYKEDEKQLADIMSDVEGLFSKLKDIGSEKDDASNKLDFETPYHTDSDDDDDNNDEDENGNVLTPPGDFRSSLKLIGMSSVVLDQLQSRHASKDLGALTSEIKHICETAGRTDMEDTFTDGEGEDGLERKGHNKGVRFDVPMNEDKVMIMATVPETVSDEGDDEDEDEGDLVFLDE